MTDKIKDIIDKALNNKKFGENFQFRTNQRKAIETIKTNLVVTIQGLDFRNSVHTEEFVIFDVWQDLEFPEPHQQLCVFLRRFAPNEYSE